MQENSSPIIQKDGGGYVLRYVPSPREIPRSPRPPVVDAVQPIVVSSPHSHSWQQQALQPVNASDLVPRQLPMTNGTFGTFSTSQMGVGTGLGAALPQQQQQQLLLQQQPLQSQPLAQPYPHHPQLALMHQSSEPYIHSTDLSLSPSQQQFTTAAAAAAAMASAAGGDEMKREPSVSVSVSVGKSPRRARFADQEMLIDDEGNTSFGVSKARKGKKGGHKHHVKRSSMSELDADTQIDDDDDDDDDDDEDSLPDDPATANDRLEMWTWDYVMVFNVGDKKKIVQTKTKEHMSEHNMFMLSFCQTLKKVQGVGLKTRYYLSVQKDEIYLLIGGTEKRLRREADRIDYDFSLNVQECIEQGCRKGIKLMLATRDRLNPVNRLIDELQWGPIYGKFDNANSSFPDRLRLYRKYNEGPRHKHSLFRSVDRIRVTHAIIEDDPILGGAGISVEKAQQSKRHGLVACFPLHDEHKLRELTTQWIAWCPPFEQPLEYIREYFGEKITMYFAFLSFYCHWLLWPAIIGGALFIWQLAEQTPDVAAAPIFGCFIALWGTAFLEFWKRKQSEYRLLWGMHHFLEKEHPRAAFAGEKLRDPVNGVIGKHFPFRNRLERYAFTQVVVFMLISLVVGCVVSIFVLRKVFIEVSPSFGPYAAAAVNFVQIQILNQVYGRLSHWLNRIENHRTPSSYENSLIVKNFIFKFVNSYNSLFYIAFFKRYDTGVGACKSDGCLEDLQIQLGAIFVLMIVVNNAAEFFIPVCRNWKRARDNRAVVGAKTEDYSPQYHSSGQSKEIPKTVAEKQFELQRYESFSDYDELVIQFGYVTLFAVAFPAAPLFALLNNVIELRLDGSKLCKLCQRPFPYGAASIGTWYTILDTLLMISLFTNILVVVFNTHYIDDWLDGSMAGKAWLFFGLENGLILLKLVMAYFIVDEPTTVKAQIARQKYIVDVLINGVVDAPDEPDLTDEDKRTGAMSEPFLKFEEIPTKLPALEDSYFDIG